MEKETMKKIFDFLKEKEGITPKSNLRFKLVFNEPLTKEDLNFNGGRLNLSNLKVKSLPEGLNVNGRLDLSYSEITLLP
jgi:hypothetical protein